MMPSVFPGIDPRVALSSPVSGPLLTAESPSGEGTAIEASFAAMISGALLASAPVVLAGDPEPVVAVPGGGPPSTVGILPPPPPEPAVPERPVLPLPGEPAVREAVVWSTRAERAAAPVPVDPAWQPMRSRAWGARLPSATTEAPGVDPRETPPDGPETPGASLSGSGRFGVPEGSAVDPVQEPEMAAVGDPRWPTEAVPVTVSQGEPDQSSPPMGLPDRSGKAARGSDDSRPASMPSGPVGQAVTRGPITPGSLRTGFPADHSEAESTRSGIHRMPGDAGARADQERDATPVVEVLQPAVVPVLDPTLAAVISVVGSAPSQTRGPQDQASDLGERAVSADSLPAGRRPGVQGSDPGTASGSVARGPLTEPASRLPMGRSLSGTREPSGGAQAPSTPSRKTSLEGSDDSRSERGGEPPADPAVRPSDLPSRGPSRPVVAGSQGVPAGTDPGDRPQARHPLDPIPDPVAPLPRGASAATETPPGPGAGRSSIDPETKPAGGSRRGRPSDPPDALSDASIGHLPRMVPLTGWVPGDPRRSELQRFTAGGNVSPAAPTPLATPASPAAASFRAEPSAGSEVLEVPFGAPPRRSPGMVAIPTGESEPDGWTAGGADNSSRLGPVVVPVAARSFETVSPGEHGSMIAPASEADARRASVALSPAVASAVRASASVPEIARAAGDRSAIPDVDPGASIAAPAVSPLEPSPADFRRRMPQYQRPGILDSPTRVPGPACGGGQAGQVAGSTSGGSAEGATGRSDLAADAPLGQVSTGLLASEIEPLRDRILRSPRVEVSGPAWVSRSEVAGWDPHLVSRSGPIQGPSVDLLKSEPVATSGAFSAGDEAMPAPRVSSADPRGLAPLQVPAPTGHEGDQNTARETDLPAEWSANLARVIPSPEAVPMASPKADIPASRSSGTDETPEKQGVLPIVPALRDDASVRGGRFGNGAGTPSAAREPAMDLSRPTSAATTPASERSDGAVPGHPARIDAAGDAMASRLHETASAGLLQAVRPAEPGPATPVPEPSGSRTPTQRLQELLTGEVALFQRLRNGSMTAVLRPEPGSELRVELRRRQGSVEIRATVERGDTRAIAEGWSELQHQLRGQGIVLHPLEREPSASAQRGAPDASGDRPSHPGGRGRHQGPAQDTAGWPDGQPKPASSVASSAGGRPPAAPRGSSRRLLESWA